jgi:hypothetical protein
MQDKYEKIRSKNKPGMSSNLFQGILQQVNSTQKAVQALGWRLALFIMKFRDSRKKLTGFLTFYRDPRKRLGNLIGFKTIYYNAFTG